MWLKHIIHKTNTILVLYPSDNGESCPSIAMFAFGRECPLLRTFQQLQLSLRSIKRYITFAHLADLVHQICQLACSSNIPSDKVHKVMTQSFVTIK